MARYDVWDGPTPPVERGDAVYCVRDSSGKTLPYQHAAIVAEVGQPNLNLPVAATGLKVWDVLPRGLLYRVLRDGPYRPQVLCKSHRPGVAHKVAYWASWLTEHQARLGPKRFKVVWQLAPHKYVEMRRTLAGDEIPVRANFSCSGFVEWCYEQARLDLVADEPAETKLPRVAGKRRLFPGYQIFAFWLERFPLDVHEASRTYRLEDLQHYRWSPDGPRKTLRGRLRSWWARLLGRGRRG